MSLDNRYKAARLARPMTQEELAIAADISVRTVRRLENGDPVAVESRRAVSAVLGLYEEPKEDWFTIPLARWEMKPAILAYLLWVGMTLYWLVSCISLHPLAFVMFALMLFGTYLPYLLAGRYGSQLWLRRELVVAIGTAAGIIMFVGSAWMVVDAWYWKTVSEWLWSRVGVTAMIVTYCVTICVRSVANGTILSRAAEILFSLGDPRAKEPMHIEKTEFERNL